MSTPTPVPTPAPAPNPIDELFSQFLNVIDNDLLTEFGGPLLTFLNADAAAGGDLAKIIAAVVALRASVLAALPENAPNYVAQVGQLNTAIATLLASKLQAWMAAQTPAAAK